MPAPDAFAARPQLLAAAQPSQTSNAVDVRNIVKRDAADDSAGGMDMTARTVTRQGVTTPAAAAAVAAPSHDAAVDDSDSDWEDDDDVPPLM